MDTKFGTDWTYSIRFHDMASRLGLSTSKDGRGRVWQGDERIAKKMEEIYVWAKSHLDGDDHENILGEVEKLRKKLGTNEQGELLINKMWQYIKMNTQDKTKTVKQGEEVETNI